jgi:hypothetical protein
MFLKLNMSLILYNPTNFAEFPIWNTLIPSRPKLPDDINDYDDNENEDDDDDDDDNEDDDVSLVLVESEETNYTC